MSQRESPALTAARELVARRINGKQGPRLSETCRPTTLEEALTIQEQVSELWCETQDDSIGAWKCSLPSTDKVVVAPIYTSTINTVAPIAVWPKGEYAHIEPELAFIFGKNLPSRSEPYTEAEVDAAIVRTHLALELINSRYENSSNASFPEMLADGLVNQGLFIGPEVDAQQSRQAETLSFNIEYANGEVKELQGRHTNNQPRAPLYWLVEFLRSRGQGILAGQAVITGSYAGVLEIPLNKETKIHYLGLGVLDVCFTAK